jgi:3-methyladenine DNA glycosylase AlkD
VCVILGIPAERVLAVRSAQEATDGDSADRIDDQAATSTESDSSPGSPQDIATEVLEAIEKLGDAERRELRHKNHPTSLRVIGATAPDLRAIEKGLLLRFRDVPANQVVELAKALVAFGVLECQQIAYQILGHHEAAQSSLGLDDIETLGSDLDNWVSVDSFALRVAGPAWREERIPDDVIHRWANSEDRWWRRAALVCTVALNQRATGVTGEPTRTLSVCRILVRDHDDMVVKGLSWALRELLRRDPDSVVGFLAEHDDVLAARVKREVRRMIEAGRQ